ncbi:MAG: hypothetical protein WD037_11390 [Balneolales bacterium]
MVQLEYKGEKHIWLSCTEGLGNNTSYNEFEENPASLKPGRIVFSKMKSLSDYGYENVRKLKCFNEASGLDGVFYYKDKGHNIRIPFFLHDVQGFSFVIMTHVFTKPTTNQENKEFKKAAKIKEEIINYLNKCSYGTLQKIIK